MNDVAVSHVYQEPDVEWPKIDKPIYTVRDLTLVSRKDHKKSEPEVVQGVRLEVLVNMCLYVVTEDHHGLRRGQILSRNLDLTRKLGGSVEEIASQCFVRYDGVNDARRGIGRIDGNYKRVEAPDVSEWRKKLDWMMRQAWTLHREDADQAGYAWVAEEVVRKHRGVKNAKKVEALEKTAQAASRQDRLGRLNPGRIPLLVGAAEDRLFDRMQHMRGIGRRMDWRAVVLEHYIDQLRSKCLEVQRDAEQKLKAETIFGKKRTTGSVRRAAEEMRAYAQHLRGFHARPFIRALTHVAHDLDEAARVIEHAAESRDAGKIKEVGVVLRRIYRSMRLLEVHWLLEEVLVLVAEAVHRKRVIENPSCAKCARELKHVFNTLSRPDAFTREPLEEGFARQMILRVRTFVNIAQLALEAQARADTEREHTRTAYHYLKEACAPF